MVCRSTARVLLVVTAFLVMAGYASAQDDTGDLPLGDVARNLRKQNAAAKPVIDDDNLSQALENTRPRNTLGDSFRYLMTGQTNGFQLAAPDVTCSLSFTANVKSLLSSQYAEMDLPPDSLAKIQARAIIEGDTFTVPVFNGTDWHISELGVAFTVVRKKVFAVTGIPDLMGSSDANPAPLPDNDPLQQVRPEKMPDQTIIYRMRAPSPPWDRAVFTAPLNMDIPAGTEWHWAIVQAKGYPPESYASPARQSTATRNEVPNYVPSSLTDVENPLAVTSR